MTRAANQARRTARAKRREFLRRNSSVIGTTIFVVAIALLVALMILPSLPLPAMIFGALALLLVLVRLARLARMPDYSVPSSLAEEWTAQEFRRMARLGWRIFDDVEWNGTRVDHVAVGPAGVLAIHTAVAHSAWNLSSDKLDGPTGDPLAHARVGADAVAAMLASAGVDTRVVPTVVVWGPGAPLHHNGQEVVDGVAILIGRQAPEWRVDLRGRNLDRALLDRIANALERTPAASPAGAVTARGSKAEKPKSKRLLARA